MDKITRKAYAEKMGIKTKQCGYCGMIILKNGNNSIFMEDEICDPCNQDIEIVLRLIRRSINAGAIQKLVKRIKGIGENYE